MGQSSRKQHDAVVIGAGHNGLVAACYLARAGLDVVVIEAAPRIGGMSTTEALIPGAPNHLVNPCAVDMILLRASPVVADLELARHGFGMREVDPPFVHLDPDGASLAIWRDPRRTAEEIARFSRRDAEAYLDLARLMDAALDVGMPYLTAHPTRPGFALAARAATAAARNGGRLARLLPMLRRSTADLIEERFEHPIVQAPLAVLTGLGPVTAANSGAYLMVYGLVHRLGVSRVMGGTQRLPDALAASLNESGGAIRTSAPVEEILVSGGRATGVRLVGGEELAAHVVVSSCDPRATLTELLPAGTLPPRVEARARAIPTSNSNLASLKVDMAFSGRLSLDRHQAQRADDVDLRVPTALLGTLDDVRAAHAAAEAGRLPDTQPMYAVIPTAVDPSQAPDGDDTLYLWQGWVPFEPRERWDDETEAVGKLVVSEASRYYDGLLEQEIGRFVEPWPTLVSRTHSTDGNLFHVDIRPSRMGPLRPAAGLGGYATPTEGLFLTGNGTHPGSGVSGLPGRHAAATVLRTRAR